MRKDQSHRSRFLGFAILFLLAFIAYGPALRGDLIWDDDAHVTKPELRSVEGLGRIWAEIGATQQYYPVLHSLFWLEHRLWGDSPVWYHAANIFWHGLAASLFVAVLLQLNVRVAWAAGFVFALHPVAVESVAWITEHKNTVSAVFYFSSALIYLRFDRERRRSQYLGALGLFALALATKTVTATLPAALLLILWWQRGRLGWRRDVAPLLPWFALGCAAGVLTAMVERYYIGAQGSDFALSFWERGLLAGRVICFYFGKLLWPVPLSFSYPKWHVDGSVLWQYLFPLVVLGAIFAALKASRVNAADTERGRAARGALTCGLFFIGTLVPVLGFLDVYPFRFSYVADHFQYLASAGAIVLVCQAFLWARETIFVSAPLVGRVVGVVVLAALGVLTWRQSRIYRNNETLFSAVVAHNPDSWLARNALGLELDRQPGRKAEAIAHYEEALRIKPDHLAARTNLAVDLAEIPGRLPEALDHLREVLRLKPDYFEGHFNLAGILVRIPGRVDEGIAHFRAALRIRPDAMVHYNIASVLAQQPGRLPEALEHYRNALRLKPHFLEAHYNFASELALIPDRLPDAIFHFDRVLQIDPQHLSAHLAIADAWAATGQIAKAISHLETALKLDPQNQIARTRLQTLRGAR